jgi:hypothetical protein
MAIGLYAIWIDMHHQSTDLAAGTGGDRHGRNGMGRPPIASRPSGSKDCAAARPDPCCRLGGGIVVGPMALLWRSLRGPARCSAGEHGAIGWEMAWGVSAPWTGAGPKSPTIHSGQGLMIQA